PQVVAGNRVHRQRRRSLLRGAPPSLGRGSDRCRGGAPGLTHHDQRADHGGNRHPAGGHAETAPERWMTSRSPPRYDEITSGCEVTSDGVPRTRTLPRSRAMISSETDVISGMSCSMINSAEPVSAFMRV